MCADGAHVDSAGITVLSLDPENAAGLQVDVSHLGTTADESKRQWVDVPYVAGGLVCTVGALLSRWTAGRWRASVHRVLHGDASRSRISVVTNALSPRPDGPPFGCFSSCVASEEVAFAPVEAKDFLTRRVALHRSEYTRENGLDSESALRSESLRVKALEV